VQNMNIMFGLDRPAGLMRPGQIHSRLDEKHPSAALPSSLVIATYSLYVSLLGISAPCILMFDQPAQYFRSCLCQERRFFAQSSGSTSSNGHR